MKTHYFVCVILSKYVFSVINNRIVQVCFGFIYTVLFSKMHVMFYNNLIVFSIICDSQFKKMAQPFVFFPRPHKFQSGPIILWSMRPCFGLTSCFSFPGTVYALKKFVCDLIWSWFLTHSVWARLDQEKRIYDPDKNFSDNSATT